MSQRNRSYVWKHFVKDEVSKKISCQHCPVKLTDCKNTSNLQNHLISQHGLKPPTKRGKTMDVDAEEELVEIVDEEVSNVTDDVVGFIASGSHASTSDGTSGTIQNQVIDLFYKSFEYILF